MAATATFGKRTASKSVQPVRRQPRQGRASPIGAPTQNKPSPTRHPEPTKRAEPAKRTERAKRRDIPAQSTVSEPILRIERTWFDAAGGAFFAFLGYSLFQGADQDNSFGLLISLGMMIGGTLVMANHLLGRAKLIVDDVGFRGDGLLLAKKMKWEELTSFRIQTVNGYTIINAKADKLPGSKSNTYVHIPNAAFKMKSLQFVEELIARRPDMAEATYDVMQHLGASKLIKKL